MAPILPIHNGGHDGRLHRSASRRSHLSFVPNRARNELIAMIAEFSGTFMFLFFAFTGTQVANAAALVQTADSTQANDSLTQAPNTSTLLYISLAFGFSLTVNVWVFFRISGGLFNPAVTLGLYLVGAVKPLRAVLCIAGQILGGIAAAAVVSAILPGPLNVSTTLSSGTSIAQGVFLEMFLTTELVFTIFMLAAEKHKATYLAPIGIGLALFIAEMAGVYFTGGSLNPARSFGPAVVTGSFDGYHWIYWIGPLLGTLVAYGFYELIKLAEYQTVNPGQDFNEQEDELFQPPEDPSTADEVSRPNVTARVAAQVADQVSQDVIEKISSGSPEALNRISSSRSEANKIASSSPEFRASLASTSVGVLNPDGTVKGDV